MGARNVSYRGYNNNMKIAVIADGPDTNALVPQHFADARWLLIADMDQKCICKAVKRNSHDTDCNELARIIAEQKCESVICGDIEQGPFEILADEGITRARGNGMTVEEALNWEQFLDLITDHVGGLGCPSSQSDETKQLHIHYRPTQHGCTHECASESKS